MLYRDLRTLDAAAAAAHLEAGGTDGAYVTAWQLAAMPGNVWQQQQERLVVTVPDFLNYARLLNTGQALAVASLPGSLARSAISGILAGFGSAGNIRRVAKMDFWAVAEVLLRYDLALLPKQFSGSVCLHSHLVDFAAVFEREDFFRTFFQLAGDRAGVHTQQLPMTLSCLARWQLAPTFVSYLCATGDLDGRSALQAAAGYELFAKTRFLAEMDSWPVDLRREAYAQKLAGISLAGILA
jgi:hypothetical protein